MVGDEQTGTMTSAPFKIFSNKITFLISGGNNYTTRLELVDYNTSEVIHSELGNNSETMEKREWDVAKYIGKTVFIRAIDQETGPWGHLNFDNIKFEK